jgi:hypothetical protein
MKKKILFLLIFFFIPSVSYSKIITLNNCRYSWEKTFQKDLYKENKIVIDTTNKNITHSILLSDINLEKNKKLNNFEYKITFVQQDNAKKEFQIFKGENKKNTINIFLKEKKIEQVIYSPITDKKISNIIYCN